MTQQQVIIMCWLSKDQAAKAKKPMFWHALSIKIACCTTGQQDDLLGLLLYDSLQRTCLDSTVIQHTVPYSLPARHRQGLNVLATLADLAQVPPEQVVTFACANTILGSNSHSRRGTLSTLLPLILRFQLVSVLSASPVLCSSIEPRTTRLTRSR